MYILAIITCEKYRKKNVRKIKNTWLKKLEEGKKYYFVFGHPEMKEEYRIDEQNHELWVKAPDNYEGLPEKVKKMFICLGRHFGEQLEGVFKIDDDIYLRPNKLGVPSGDYQGHLVNIGKAHMSTWHFGKCQDPVVNRTPYLTPNGVYCSGTLYFLSKKCFDLLEKHKDEKMITIFEDTAMGYFLNKNGITPVDQNYHTREFKDWMINKEIPGFHDEKHTADFFDIMDLGE